MPTWNGEMRTARYYYTSSRKTEMGDTKAFSMECGLFPGSINVVLQCFTCISKSSGQSYTAHIEIKHRRYHSHEIQTRVDRATNILRD